MFRDAKTIIDNAIRDTQPEKAVRKALESFKKNKEGRLILLAIGKAAWKMAKSAYDVLSSNIDEGLVITKHGYSEGSIGDMVIMEAGHPISDCFSYYATEMAMKLCSNLTINDTILFLVSGGGSALFEKPYIDESELEKINASLLKSGASITEINTIRKRLSMVKGGRFAELAMPAHIFQIVLSDIIGDPLDMIASGPAYPDSSTRKDAAEIIEKYGLELSEEAKKYIDLPTPKTLSNVESHVTGSVRELCLSARITAEKLGYESRIVRDDLEGEASSIGVMIANLAKTHQNTEKSLCFIFGGESTVHVKGAGLGGRNQEICLSAAIGIKGLKDTAIFSIGSDGTDGPTDAAGAYVDGDTASRIEKPEEYLVNNDSYHAFEKIGNLIFTGPTGTNVNDLTVLLIKR